jgi:kumamolisin
MPQSSPPASDHAVTGSERYVLPGAREVGPADPDERLEVTVYVRRDPHAPDLPEPDVIGAQPPHPGRHLSHDAFIAAYRASDDDLDQVAAFAQQHGLQVVARSPERRSVVLAGPVAALERAFGVRLARYEIPGGHYRGRTGAVHVPAALADVVEGVFGLDNRRLGKSWRRPSRYDAWWLAAASGEAEAAAGPQPPPNTYLPPELARLYSYPAGADGSGQCVAILAFNDPVAHGGYQLDALTTYFEQVLHQSAPEIANVVVAGPGNDPGDDGIVGERRGDSSGEIMLDMQVVGGIAPGARIVMYFTEFTERGWVDAITTILTDGDNNPSVISCSYGNPEDDPRSAWTTMAINKVNDSFSAAAGKGVTICCASGDDGSRDQGGGNRAHADFPAASPFVLGVGGTTLIASGPNISSETVWNDGPGSATGGGVSRLFAVPPWQQSAGVPPSANPGHKPGRGVPDVSADGDPNTGVIIIKLDGRHLTVIGGTSAAAPQWAALIALLNQRLGARVGFLNPALYARFETGVLRDIVTGNNGAYHAGPGWDPCTGFGSPNGSALLDRLQHP